MNSKLKGIVMNTDSNYAIIMTNSGEFIKVKNKKYNIGQEIIASKYESQINLIRYSTIAALIILTIISSIYLKNIYATVAYIDLDINPSIELGINKYNEVTKIVALNNDASILLHNLNLKNENISTAFNEIIVRAKAAGYLSEDKENIINIAFVKIKDEYTNITTDELLKNSIASIENSNIEVTFKFNDVTKDVYKAAQNSNISINKYIEKNNSENQKEIKVNNGNTNSNNVNNSNSKTQNNINSNSENYTNSNNGNINSGNSGNANNNNKSNDNENNNNGSNGNENNNNSNNSNGSNGNSNSSNVSNGNKNATK